MFVNFTSFLNFRPVTTIGILENEFSPLSFRRSPRLRNLSESFEKDFSLKNSVVLIPDKTVSFLFVNSANFSLNTFLGSPL